MLFQILGIRNVMPWNRKQAPAAFVMLLGPPFILPPARLEKGPLQKLTAMISVKVVSAFLIKVPRMKGVSPFQKEAARALMQGLPLLKRAGPMNELSPPRCRREMGASMRNQMRSLCLTRSPPPRTPNYPWRPER